MGSLIVLMTLLANPPMSHDLGVSPEKVQELTDIYDAELKLREYETSKKAYLSVKNKLKRSKDANQRIQGVVSQDTIDNLSIKVKIYEEILHIKRREWRTAVRLQLPVEDILVKTDIGLGLYLELKEKYPDEVFRVELDGASTYLMTPKMWKFYNSPRFIMGKEIPEKRKAKYRIEIRTK